MKKLFLVRHARAKDMDSFVKDIDRPLSKPGYEDAYRISEQIIPVVTGNILLVCSPSVRTYSTAAIFADTLKKSRSSVRCINKLYNTGTDEYFDVISSVEDGIDTVLLFGHNPVISDMIIKLSGINHGNISPCTVAYFEAEMTTWTAAFTTPFVLKGLFSPKS